MRLHRRFGGKLEVVLLQNQERKRNNDGRIHNAAKSEETLVNENTALHGLVGKDKDKKDYFKNNEYA